MKKKITNILVIVLISILSLAIGVSAATTIASTSVTYGDTNVKVALDELMSVVNQCAPGALCSKANIGDYVKMTPTQTTYTISSTSTGYDSDQTINPSELNIWRIIDIRTDGTIEMVSEYVSSTDVYFKGKVGYLNFIGALNNIANQYGNSKYTIDTRYMGYDGQTSTITDTSKFTTTAPWTKDTNDNSNETVGGGDIMYEHDTNASTGLVYKAVGTLKAKKVGTTTEAHYWLGSRSYVYSTTFYSWRGRIVSAYGSVMDHYLSIYDAGEWHNDTYNRALRPIVTLRANVTTSSGNGSSGSPWILS